MSELDIEAFRLALRPDPTSNAPDHVWLPRAGAEAILAALERGQQLEERLRELHGRIAEALEG